MSKIFTKQEYIRFRDCDEAGRLKLSALLELIQEISSDHMDELGLGRFDLAKRNIAWVIARTHLQMARMPRMDETITIETFVNGHETIICPRYTVFRDGTGAQIGGVATQWIIIDTEARKPLRAGILDDMPGMADMQNDLPVPVVCDNRLRLTGELAPVEVRTVRNTDADMNGHMHNTRYAEFVCDLLPHDVFLKSDVREFDINYSREVRPGQAVELSWAQDGSVYEVRGMANGEKCFEVRLTL